MKAKRKRTAPALNALGKYLVELRRTYPSIADDQVLKRLNAPVIEGGTILQWLAYCNRITVNGREEERRQSWLKWRKMDQRILGVMGRVRAAPIAGGPRPCAECGARSVAERTVWCVSGCPPSLDVGKGRKDRILTELDAARPIRGHTGAIRPYIASRGGRSRLAWLPMIAASIAGYLASVTRDDTKKPNVYEAVARILALGTGEKITEAMVKDRVSRHAGNK